LIACGTASRCGFSRTRRLCSLLRRYRKHSPKPQFQLAAQVGPRDARLRPRQGIHDPTVGESGLLQVVEPFLSENSTSDSAGFQGGLPGRLLPSTRRADHHDLTHTKGPPQIPGRFRQDGWYGLATARGWQAYAGQAAGSLSASSLWATLCPCV
jgi:hypothetical protein